MKPLNYDTLSRLRRKYSFRYVKMRCHATAQQEPSALHGEGHENKNEVSETSCFSITTGCRQAAPAPTEEVALKRDRVIMKKLRLES